MYQAFYRKYRPRCFCDVSGQEHITETLRRQIQSDRLSHAYLFVGTRGTGKTTCAKILARAVNCQMPAEGEPCNKCISCSGIEDGSILDVLELDAASNNSVDNVRALRDEAVYSPAVVKKRVYIIDEVHMLSTSAFNALLKILEEPPEHILFILATTELHKVPATIQSRCQRFSFRRLLLPVLASRLDFISSTEGLTLTNEASYKLAMLADGSMRDAISLLDQCASADIIDHTHVLATLGIAGQQELMNLTDAVIARDVLTALNILDKLYADGKDMSSVLGEMVTVIRDLLVFKLSSDSGLLDSGHDRTVLSELSKKISPERLFFCLDVLKTAITGLTRSGNSKLSVEMCLMKMCDERLSDDTSALLSRISQLETNGYISIADTAVTTDRDFKHRSDAIADRDVDAVTDRDAEVKPETVESGPSLTTVPDDFWTNILSILKKDPSVYALLSDNSKVQAKHNNNTLNIKVADSFTANLIKSEFSELIKEAAFSVFNRNVIISVELGVENVETNKQSKLESLSAFDIVNFE
ncbi:MAG: DNA polymerase III subunit gamma/tau [Oscillospiraceae bacterium]|jgi:DNA polymerase-3 subunit gamma/tau|nr:DNA polymerase III subunit gamma/tau [Oscillospiraceae bacterium]